MNLLQQDSSGGPGQLLARDYFGARAARYRQSHGNEEALALIVQMADLKGDEFMLDVGTGPGHLACAFAPHVRTVVASDLAMGMLREIPTLIQEKEMEASNLWRVATDAMSIPFQNDSFDLITSRLAAAHFPNHAPAVMEMARVCKPGGKVLIADSMGPEDAESQVYIDDIERFRDSSHVCNHSHTEWHQAYENAGLEVLDVQVTRGRMRNIIFWMDRADTPPENRERIYSMLKNPPESVKRHVDLGQDEDGNWYFTTAQIRILGRKR